MTPKQELFCKEYLVDLNSTQAAIRAGYSKRTAHRIGNENVRKPAIAHRIAELMNERAKRTEITGDQVIQALAAIAFADRRAILSEDFDGIPDELEPSFEGVEYTKFGPKYKFASREKALELLGKHFGLFTDRIEHKVAMATVQITLPDNGRGTDAEA